MKRYNVHPEYPTLVPYLTSTNKTFIPESKGSRFPIVWAKNKVVVLKQMIK